MKTRLLALVLVLVLGVVPAAHAFAVTDVARLVQQVALRITQEMSYQRMASHYRIMRRWGRRLSIFENLSKYVPAHVPLWRTWRQYDPMREALDIMNTLNFGLGVRGAAAILGPRVVPDVEIPRPPEVEAGLAQLELAESVILGGFDQTGRIRGAEDIEEAVLARLEQDVRSASGGTTARADVLTAAAAIRAAQGQTRVQLLLSIGEQLTVDALREREMEAAVQRMRVAALQKPAPTSRNDAQALRTWRMP